MDFHDIEQKDKEELKTMLAEQQAIFRELRFKAHEGQLRTLSEIQKTRKIIARIQTALKKQS